MKKYIANFIVLTWLLQGCSGFTSQQKIQMDLANVSEGNKTAGDQRPYCEIDYADYQLDTHLLAFEITDKSNIGFGFNLLTGFLRAIGLNIKTEKGKMLMSMHMSESLRPHETVANVMGQGESKTTDFSMNLDLLRLGFDISYYYQTPVSKLTEKTLDDSLNNLKNSMSRVETPWSSRVVYLYENEGQVIIPAGTVAGVRLGDKFNIYNVEYAWRGEPCSSELLFEKKNSVDAMAVAEVVQLEKNASLLKIIEVRSEEPIEYGAKVEIAQLQLNSNEKSRQLLRSVRLRNFESEPLSLTSDAKVDLSLYMSEQTQSLLNRHGYYPRK